MASYAAQQTILFGASIDPDDAINALDETPFEAVAQVAREIPDSLAVACVGPHTTADFA